MTQQEIGDHLDMTQQAASQWLARLEIDWRSSTLKDIRTAYIRQLREQAAGRASAGDLDLANERAGLAKAQRERVEMQNAITRRELLPAVLITEVLAKAGSKVAGILDAIPGMVRRRVTGIPVEVLNMIAGEVARARNIAAAIKLEDLEETDEPGEKSGVTQ